MTDRLVLAGLMPLGKSKCARCPRIIAKRYLRDAGRFGLLCGWCFRGLPDSVKDRRAEVDDASR